MTQVDLRSVRKAFGSFVAIEDISLSIRSGELVALLGPSGCGKTTTLRTIAGLEVPTAGEILFDGKDVSPLRVQDRNVGMVFQRYALFPHMTVEKNVAFGLSVRGVPKAEIADRTDDFAVVATIGNDSDLPADPRLASMGGRQIVTRKDARDLIEDAQSYARHRMTLGVAELIHDFVSGDIFPHEASYDLLKGVDFDKGCFVGQEVVSRMQHRGTARKRFVPVTVTGNRPAMGTDITANGRVIGTMGGASEAIGLALLRLDRLEEAGDGPLDCGDAKLAVHRQAWLPQAGGAEH